MMGVISRGSLGIRSVQDESVVTSGRTPSSRVLPIQSTGPRVDLSAENARRTVGLVASLRAYQKYTWHRTQNRSELRLKTPFASLTRTGEPYAACCHST
jgi:hypothetical protein